MALIVKDRVKETTTTEGTGTVTLAGASAGFRSFADIGNGNETYYCISGGSQFEVGIGTYTASGTTLSRDMVLSNSSGTQPTKINFSAGSKDVFVTYPSEKAIYEDAGNNVVVNGTTALLTDASRGNITINGSFSSILNFGIANASAGYIFQTPTDLTVWNANAGSMVLGTNNSERMRISAAGNVGIGTSSPTTSLGVTGAIANVGSTSSLSFTGTASVANASAASAAAGTHGSSLVFAQSWTSGTPSSVIATGQITGVKLANDGSFGGGLAFWTSNGSGNDLAERMRIDSNGNVGIGLTTPPNYGAGYITVAVNGTTGSVFDSFVNGLRTGSFFSTSASANIMSTVAVPLIFGTNATERMRIHASGGVSIGNTTDPGASNLLVAGNIILGGALTEDVYAVVDAAGVPLSPTNGTIQTWTLGASRTPTAGTWDAGQSMTLMINDGTAYTITWSTLAVTWVGGTAPTLATTGFTIIELWKVGSTIYGALVGSVA